VLLIYCIKVRQISRCAKFRTTYMRNICPGLARISKWDKFGRGTDFARLGQISKKGPDAGFAGAGAEIRYIPNRKSYTRFRLVPESSTLKHNYVKTNECRPILSAAKM